jgi:hypothetical protein
MKYPRMRIYKPQTLYKRDQRLMRLVNIRLHELTGNDMYLWLSGHMKELKKIKDGQN